ncbi:hypothetical protein FOA52_006888 [Chlamydomonas sp. UWO 241]|nr:hypothetical protein FOA52_006888 [Chlamydomonas sp. UWO 241]
MPEGTPVEGSSDPAPAPPQAQAQQQPPQQQQQQQRQQQQEQEQRQPPQQQPSHAAAPIASPPYALSPHRPAARAAHAHRAGMLASPQRHHAHVAFAEHFAALALPPPPVQHVFLDASGVPLAQAGLSGPLLGPGTAGIFPDMVYAAAGGMGPGLPGAAGVLPPVGAMAYIVAPGTMGACGVPGMPGTAGVLPSGGGMAYTAAAAGAMGACGAPLPHAAHYQHLAPPPHAALCLPAPGAAGTSAGAGYARRASDHAA